MIKSSFKAKSGAMVAGVGLEPYRQAISELISDFHISPLQISEAAGFSMAMVVRYALGLEAAGGNVIGLVRDSLAGAIASATLRHLVNSGASAMIGIEAEPNDQSSPAYVQQLEALNALEVPIFLFSQVSKSELETGINNSHNVIVGLYDHLGDNHVKHLWPVIDSLNESATPIHAIGAPLEMDVDTGKSYTNALYASSTLALGLPFSGFSAGKDLVGRHYVCDISMPVSLQKKHGIESDFLFSEQPVVAVEPFNPPEIEAKD